jgi:hypothetical protein
VHHFTPLDARFAEHYGVTEAEADEAIRAHGLSTERAGRLKDWCLGYTVPGYNGGFMANPWSFYGNINSKGLSRTYPYSL